MLSFEVVHVIFEQGPCRGIHNALNDFSPFPRLVRGSQRRLITKERPY